MNLLSHSAVAASSPKRPFDIPAGEAAAALKQFKTQSGEQILYSIDAVSGVRSHAVKGEMTAREALERMFFDTGLLVTQDEENGALSLVPRRRGLERPAGSATDSGQPGAKKRNAFALLRTLLGLSVAVPAAGASVDRPTGEITGRVQNAVSGQYLNNARVSLRGTDFITFTDQSGTYRLNNVPAGSAELEVFYTGLDPQTARVTVPGGASVVQHFELTSRSRYGDRDGVVALDSFMVTSVRETDASAIAINEQRYSANIKNVVAADEYGDVLGGNVGEFLRFLPGVLWADTGETEVNEISIRGFSSNLATFSSDGLPIANAPTSGTARVFQLKQVSLNNVSRVEVTKVPTPATRADSMSGSVNMVSKSAFERSKAQLNYRFSLTANSRDVSLKRTPRAFEKMTYKIYPGVDFDYTLPVNENLGLVITGLYSVLDNPQDFSSRNYAVTGAGTGASVSRPFLQENQLVDAYRTSKRQSASIKVDWRMAPHSVLSASVQAGSHLADPANYNIFYRTGTNGNPTVNGGVPLSYGDDYTIGATGRGSVVMGGGFNRNAGATTAGNLRYVFDHGDWKITASGSHSASRYWRRNTERGFFTAMQASLRMPVRISFLDVDQIGPGVTRAFDNNNQEIDLYDGSNYNVTGATAAPIDTRDEVDAASLDVRRNLDFLPFSAVIQVGGMYNRQERDAVGSPMSWTYRGINGNQEATPLLAQVYGNEVHYFSNVDRPIPWVSPVVAWRAFEADPSLFFQTPTQILNAERDRIRASRFLQETVSAYYFQVEGRFLDNRLHVLTGVRYEKTKDVGRGPLRDTGAAFVRNPDGSFALDGNGNRIRRPEAGAAGSLEELRVIEVERAYHAARSYDGYYPSLHVNFNVTDNFLARVAYAKSYGRPDFSDIIPSLTSENEVDDGDITDPTQARGIVNVTNIGLKPWMGDNFDVSLEYYTPQGGLFSAGAFLKEIKDFFGTSSKIATQEDLDALGLDSRYLGWQVNTRINSGDARISGFEFNFKHSLRPLGEWGRYVSIFVNGTKLRLEGNNEADFSGFIPESLNWGFSFNRGRWLLVARWNYMGKNRGAPVAALGPEGYNYFQFESTPLDVNVEYRLSHGLRLYVNAKNLLHEPRLQYRYGADTPDYAERFQTRSFGVIFSAGVKGVF